MCVCVCILHCLLASFRIEGSKNCTGCVPGFFKSASGFELCSECAPGELASTVAVTQCWLVIVCQKCGQAGLNCPLFPLHAS